MGGGNNDKRDCDDLNVQVSKSVPWQCSLKKEVLLFYLCYYNQKNPNPRTRYPNVLVGNVSLTFPMSRHYHKLSTTLFLAIFPLFSTINPKCVTTRGASFVLLLSSIYIFLHTTNDFPWPIIFLFTFEKSDMKMKGLFPSIFRKLFFIFKN